jgi:hypothetical protein
MSILHQLFVRSTSDLKSFRRSSGYASLVQSSWRPPSSLQPSRISACDQSALRECRSAGRTRQASPRPRPEAHFRRAGAGPLVSRRCGSPDQLAQAGAVYGSYLNRVLGLLPALGSHIAEFGQPAVRAAVRTARQGRYPMKHPVPTDLARAPFRFFRSICRHSEG